MVDIYKKLTGGGIKVQKPPGGPCTTLCKIKLADPTDIDRYRSFVVQIMWYTKTLGPKLVNASREMDIHMIHFGI